jgi:hypothetical protein
MKAAISSNTAQPPLSSRMPPPPPPPYHLSSSHRWHQYRGDDPKVPFEVQAERLIGAWHTFDLMPRSSVLEEELQESDLATSFGGTRPVPFGIVIDTHTPRREICSATSSYS